MKIYSVYTDEFKPYGKILQNYDTQSLISAMRTIPLPESGTAYEPSISALEESGIFDAMQNRAYGGMPIQIGMCWGYNTKLNCLEYHRDSEVNAGETDALVETWKNRLIDRFQQGKGMSRKQMQAGFKEICDAFKAVPVENFGSKVRVGVVGEIYVKFSSLGNNQLEKFLLSEGAEPVVPGLTDFLIFKIFNREVDVNIYGGKWIKKKVCQIFKGYVEQCQRDMIDALNNSHYFKAPGTFEDLHRLVHGYLGEGCKMGEGWLLTAEMLELIHSGTPNIVCAQPFGCLPNHIVGKGMVNKIRALYPASNITPIDYDPSATKVNQENRIKLMLAVAKERLNNPVQEPIKPLTAEELAGGAPWLSHETANV